MTEENLTSQQCASLPVEREAVPKEAQSHSGGVQSLSPFVWP